MKDVKIWVFAGTNICVLSFYGVGQGQECRWRTPSLSPNQDKKIAMILGLNQWERCYCLFSIAAVLQGDYEALTEHTTFWIKIFNVYLS